MAAISPSTGKKLTVVSPSGETVEESNSRGWILPSNLPLSRGQSDLDYYLQMAERAKKNGKG